MADSYSATEDTPLVVAGPGVLANDSDPDGTPLTAVLVTGPTRGTLVLNPDGSFTYTPQVGSTGIDSFTYRANDGTVLETSPRLPSRLQPRPTTPRSPPSTSSPRPAMSP